MRLIDADAFKRYLDDGDECINCPKKAMFCSYKCDLDNVESSAFSRIIDEQPTIDAVPVVHGEWVWEDSVCSPRTCSVCKQKFYIGRGWNFCPNCGAKMDGKEQENEQ